MRGKFQEQLKELLFAVHSMTPKKKMFSQQNKLHSGYSNLYDIKTVHQHAHFLIYT